MITLQNNFLMTKYKFDICDLVFLGITGGEVFASAFSSLFTLHEVIHLQECATCMYKFGLNPAPH